MLSSTSSRLATLSVFLLVFLDLGSSIANAITVKLGNSAQGVTSNITHSEVITKRDFYDYLSAVPVPTSNGNVGLTFDDVDCPGSNEDGGCQDPAASAINAVLRQFMYECGNWNCGQGYEWGYSGEATDGFGYGIYPTIIFRVGNALVLDQLINDMNAQDENTDLEIVAYFSTLISEYLADYNTIMVCVEFTTSTYPGVSTGPTAIVLGWNNAAFGFADGQIDTILDYCNGAF